jgi:tetratricopeptide (TPR) repeat protein
LPDLAWSLNALANRLTALGRAADALAPAEEAVELYRQLSQTDPQAYAETLFWTINDLTKRFAKLYRLKDAWRTLQEATQVRIDYNLDWRGKLRERS